MRKFIKYILAITIVIAGAISCNEYDDGPLSNRLDSVENRVESLERLSSQMNTNITALQTAVKALQENDYVTSIAEVKERDKVIGYTITFAKSGVVTIYHGVDGHMPIIGVNKAGDGLYYWTIDDKWVTNSEGKKLKAEGNDGITPRLKIENGKWILSMDNGKSWTDIGQATGDKGDSFFNSITENDEYIYLNLANGAIITLPKQRPLSITFDRDSSIPITSGATETINYTINGANEKTIVKAFGQNGWSAKVISIDNNHGTITVTAPNPIIEDEIIVLVYDGKDKTIMSSINFITGTIKLATEIITVPSNLSIVDVEVKTNIEYKIEIPLEAQNWLSVAATTKLSMRNEVIKFQVAENKGFARYTTVELKNNSGITLQTIGLKQDDGISVINLSAHIKSNCYIIDSEGIYKFDTSEHGTKTEAFLLWNENGEFDIENVLLRDNDVYFTKTSNIKGNAVISIMNDNEILSSWHIWTTDIPEIYEINNIKWLDRNIGATSTSPNDPNAYGLFYNFGNPHPFPGAKYKDFAINDTPSVPEGWYVAEGYGFYTSNKIPSKSNPMQLCTNIDAYGNSSYFNNYYSNVNSPCPMQLSIPSRDVLQGTIGLEPVFNNLNGVLIDSNIFFPAAGFSSGSSYYNQDIYGYYWANGIQNTSAVNGYAFIFWDSLSKRDYLRSNNLAPIRAVSYFSYQ